MVPKWNVSRLKNSLPADELFCFVKCGDSSSMEEVASNSVQMAIASFPEVDLTVSDNMPKLNFREWHEAGRILFPLYPVLDEILRTLSTNGVFILDIGTPSIGGVSWTTLKQICPSLIPFFPYQIVKELMTYRVQWQLLYDFVWFKTPRDGALYGPVSENGIFYLMEHFFVFGKTPNIKMHLTKRVSTVQVEPAPFPTLLELPSGDSAVITPFPPQIVSTFIDIFTDPHDIVLDPCAGTGSLGDIAIPKQRNVILYEKEPTRIPLIEQRMKKVKEPFALKVVS